jgi:hypothetical protein
MIPWSLGDGYQVFASIFSVYSSPLPFHPEVYESPDHAAHYHIRNLKVLGFISEPELRSLQSIQKHFPPLIRRSVGHEVLTAAVTKSSIFRAITLYKSDKIQPKFRSNILLPSSVTNLQKLCRKLNYCLAWFSTSKMKTWFFRNDGLSPNCTALQKTVHFTVSYVWKPH